MARSTFPSQNAKSTTCSDNCRTFRCRIAWRSVLRTLSKESKTCEGFVAVSTITPVQYTKLDYTTLHDTTLHSTLQLQVTPTLQYTNYMRYTTLHHTPLHYTICHYTTFHFSTLHYTTLQDATLHNTTQHYTTLHYSAPHKLQLQLQRQLLRHALHAPRLPGTLRNMT